MKIVKELYHNEDGFLIEIYNDVLFPVTERMKEITRRVMKENKTKIISSK